MKLFKKSLVFYEIIYDNGKILSSALMNLNLGQLTLFYLVLRNAAH